MADPPQDARYLTERELVLQTYEMTKQLHAAVFGNGQPGLWQRVSRLEAFRYAVTAVASVLVLQAGWTVVVLMRWLR